MNISLHTRVRQRGRGGKRLNEGYAVRAKKVGDFEMHEESSQFPSLCPVSRVSYAPPTHSLVYRNRRTACEYPVLSCDVVSVAMCVRKRWFMMGVWWEWRVMSCYCRRCHKMFISSPSNGLVYILRPTSLGHSVEESSTPTTTTAPGNRMHITDMKRHSLTNRMLKRVSTDCK